MSARQRDYRRPPQDAEEARYRRITKELRRVRACRAALAPKDGDVVYVRILFSEEEDSKVRPAIVISNDGGCMTIVPLSSKRLWAKGIMPLTDWEQAGLSMPSRLLPVRLISSSCVLSSIGRVTSSDWRRVVSFYRDHSYAC